MGTYKQKPVVEVPLPLQSYYASLESKIGYRVLLGDTRHYGYYPPNTYWPFPINRALRAMENHLFNSLKLERGAKVLDAGCGSGHVAIHMARRGLRLQAVDVIDRHLRSAREIVEAEGLEEAVRIRKMDYNHLDGLPNDSLDGAYTMETFVHGRTPEKALREFFRVLKPGSPLVLYEYDHYNLGAAPKDAKESFDTVTKYAAMPSWNEKGVLEKMLEQSGFHEIVVRDLTANMLPMLRLFFLLAYIPYILVRFFGLQASFINTVAAVEGYRAVGLWRYIAVTARKPLEEKHSPPRKFVSGR